MPPGSGAFSWDATFYNDPAFEEFFVTRIGPDTQTTTQFWWLAVNGKGVDHRRLPGQGPGR